MEDDPYTLFVALNSEVGLYASAYNGAMLFLFLERSKGESLY